MARESINLQELEGKWYIISTNFPMWLKGDKINPNFNYKISEKDGVIGLIDEVKYTQNGRIKSIEGFDKPLNIENTFFEWRGNGFLSLLSSKWQILYFDSTKQWAIIYFEPTIFTPKGWDVICRESQISSLIMRKVEEKVRELKIFDKLIKL
jgi:lipocalin|nr:lipocalin family protein [uncultured Emticicia sp.]